MYKVVAVIVLALALVGILAALWPGEPDELTGLTPTITLPVQVKPALWLPVVAVSREKPLPPQ